MSSFQCDPRYAPIAGVGSYLNLSLEFAYGADSVPLKEKRIAAVQTISGTGACRLAGEFIRKFVGQGRAIHVPNPTWGNHIAIFENAGLKPTYYPYYDSQLDGVAPFANARRARLGCVDNEDKLARQTHTVVHYFGFLLFCFVFVVVVSVIYSKQSAWIR